VVAEEFEEAVEDGFILPVGVRLLQGFDLLEVFRYGDMQGRLLGRFAGPLQTGHTQSATFQFVFLAPLCFERLGGRGAGRLAPAFAAGVPLDEI
jgi:hypothetical protein